MPCCSHCQDAGNFFNDKTAKRELRKYLKKGPNNSTGLLLGAIRELGVQNKTLLDIGSGVGVIHHELFSEGLQSATVVDASNSYLKILGNEAERRGNKERLTTYFGDFVEVAPEISPADIVTLDRVICCYPDMGKLVHASLSKANFCCGMVIPRENWFIKTGAYLGNLYFQLRGMDFRAYIHSGKDIEEICREHGFKPLTFLKTFFWQVAVFVKK